MPYQEPDRALPPMKPPLRVDAQSKTDADTSGDQYQLLPEYSLANWQLPEEVQRTIERLTVKP